MFYFNQGVPHKRPHPLTEPESPAIVKRPRIAAGPSQPEKPDSSVMVARPAPKFDRVFKVKYPDRQPVVPQPFSFEERDKNKPAKQEEVSGNCIKIFKDLFSLFSCIQVAPSASTLMAKPAPKFDKVFKVKYSDKLPVIPLPFSFEGRDKDNQAKLEREVSLRTSENVWEKLIAQEGK